MLREPADTHPPARRVAVVIVTYRTAELTIQCLRSVNQERLAGTLRLSAFVVDNDSGDARTIAQAIAAQHWSSWVTLIAAPGNGGFGYGNNLGIQRALVAAQPDYVYLLNPDAEVRSGAIAALARFLDAHADAGIAGSGFETQDGAPGRLRFGFRPSSASSSPGCSGVCSPGC